MAWQWLEDFKRSAAQKVAQFKNSTFRDASMATCALIAAADGQVDASEKSKVAALISKCELLQCFDGSELKKVFEAACDKAGDEFSRIDLLRTVGKLHNTPEQADTCIRVALIIANADGDFSEPEKVVVRELCQTLGLSAAGYVQ